MDDLALLKLQLEWGADEALDTLPRDRWGPPQPIVSEPPVHLAPTPAASPQPQPAGAAARAAALAASATTLEQLAASLAGFTDCPLQSTAIHLVFAAGDRAADLMVIGDTPGEDEDRSGRPFDGPGGRLLDRMLGTIGLDRTRLRLAYVIPWRPPGNRKATPHERLICLPFLRRQIALVGPRRLLLLGKDAAASLLEPSTGARRARSGWREIRIEGLDTQVACLPTCSPEHLIATPAAKREAWADLITLRLALDADRESAPDITRS